MIQRRLDSGFTLIELLVVVAIIAILAAIAIPNMLAAQTRAKVSRAKADLSSVATAIEVYRVDNNQYPTYHYTKNAKSPTGYTFHFGGEVNGPFDSPPFPGPHPLTSPIAYITRFPSDIFGTRSSGEAEEAGDYLYVNWDYAIERVHFAAFTAMRNTQGNWRLHTNGPDLTGPDSEVSTGDDIIYDPTNGTISKGDICRTQKQGVR